jgi:hypothetical protein
VITQSRLFSYIDIYFCLAMLGVLALISIGITRANIKTSVVRFFHPW